MKKPKNMSESDYMKMLAAERKKENKSVNESKLRNSSPKPVQGAGNMPSNDEQAARQVEFLKSKNKEKKVKGMNMGGMAGAPQSGPKKPMMPPKRKPAPRPTPVVDPMAKAPNPRMKDPREKGSAMPMMKKGGDVKGYDKGGKVRGYGMARGGKACKMR